MVATDEAAMTGVMTMRSWHGISKLQSHNIAASLTEKQERAAATLFRTFF
jgi:hypothetical protein